MKVYRQSVAAGLSSNKQPISPRRAVISTELWHSVLFLNNKGIIIYGVSQTFEVPRTFGQKVVVFGAQTY